MYAKDYPAILTLKMSDVNLTLMSQSPQYNLVQAIIFSKGLEYENNTEKYMFEPAFKYNY